MASSMNRVIMTGNPGTGKSTILNTLVGSAQFRSGVAVGTGMTTVLKDYTANGWVYTDTPGLEDVSTRKRAAQEISNALRKGGNIKLVFVMTLESGRLRPVDITTMTQILDAIVEAGVDVNRKFTVLLNKVTRQVMARISNPNEMEILIAQVCQKYNVGFAGCLDFEPDAHDEENKTLRARGGILQMLEKAPFITIEEGAKIKVDPSQFEEKVRDMEAKMAELRNNAAESARIIRRLEKDALVDKSKRIKQEEMHDASMKQMQEFLLSERTARMYQEAEFTKAKEKMENKWVQQEEHMAQVRLAQQAQRSAPVHCEDSDSDDDFWAVLGINVATAAGAAASACSMQ